MLPIKVEIKLKKAEPVSWGVLEYRKRKLSNGTKQTFNSGTIDKHKKLKCLF